MKKLRFEKPVADIAADINVPIFNIILMAAQRTLELKAGYASRLPLNEHIGRHYKSIALDEIDKGYYTLEDFNSRARAYELEKSNAKNHRKNK